MVRLPRIAALVLALALAACGDPTPQRKARPPAAIEDAQRLRARLDIRQLSLDLEQYRALHGAWPESWREVGRARVDPWGGEYLFDVDDGGPIVCSAGPDGEAGTDDDVYSDG